MLGIGGAGMSALAEVLLDDGINLSGCDTSHSPRLEEIRALGAKISEGHSRSHLNGVDLLVTTAAVEEEHEEILEARKRNIPVISRAELLAESMRGCELVAIAGTHGKTTTSAILAHLLEECGARPSVALGGVIAGKNRAGWRGSSSPAVCEADEYNRSFLQLQPLFAVLTNLEAEHLEYFGTEAALNEAFEKFLARVPVQGKIWICGDDPGASKLCWNLRADCWSYGIGVENKLRAEDLGFEDGMRSFKLLSEGRSLGMFRLPLPGRHNLLNATGALGAALEFGLSPEMLRKALEAFPGIRRRFEKLGEQNGILFIDDYAHHPTEVAALLSAARESQPSRRLIVLFQPHLFSRTLEFADSFARVLSEADLVIVLPIFASREKKMDGVSHHLILKAMENTGTPAYDGISLHTTSFSRPWKTPVSLPTMESPWSIFPRSSTASARPGTWY